MPPEVANASPARKKSYSAGLRVDEHLESVNERINVLQSKLNSRESEVTALQNHNARIRETNSALFEFKKTFKFLNVFFSACLTVSSLLLAFSTYSDEPYKSISFGGGLFVGLMAISYQLISGFVKDLSPDE